MKNILIVTYWSFKDPLVQTYTLPYVYMIQKYLPEGSKIFLFTLEQKSYAYTPEEFKKIKKEYESKNIYIVSSGYTPFGLKAIFKLSIHLLKLSILCKKNKVQYIHAWCTPGGAIGYILSRLTNIPLILDSFEPHAEVMAEGGVWHKNSLAYRLLFYFEKKQVQRAKIVIGLTEGMRDYTKAKYHVNVKRYYVKPAGVDFHLFNCKIPIDTELQKELGLTDKIVCVYAGKIGGIYLTSEIFRLFKTAHDYWGDRFRVLFLTKTPQSIVYNMAIENQLNPAIIITKFVEHSQINKYLQLGNFALNPVRPVPSKRYCTSIKDGEYWAMGLPIIIPTNIADDSEIIEQNQIGSILKGFSKENLLNSIKEIDNLLTSFSKEELAEKISGIGKKYRNFDNAKDIYRDIYLKTNDNE